MRRGGAALILVVVVIAALVAISAPFVVSMRLHEKSARGFASRVRARRLAEAARNDAVAALIASHPDEERRARIGRGDPNGDDEDWDALDEVDPKTRDLVGFSADYPVHARGPRTTILEVQTRDERSKIDINGCGADPVANLLGVTITTEEISYDETSFLPLEDVRPFYSDGDTSTLDGKVIVNGEHIGYLEVSTNPPGLRGLVRGMDFTRAPPPEDGGLRKSYHPAGSLVQDYRGRKVALDAVFRWVGTEREGELARFETPSAIRKIAEWPYSTFSAAYFLHGKGITFAKLRELGITGEKLERAGLDPQSLDKAGSERDAAFAKRLEEAVKGLRRLGLDPEKIRRYRGDYGVARAWEMLKTLEEDQQRKLIEAWNDRAAKIDAADDKHEAFYRGEIKRQIEDMIALREKTPEIEAIGRIELERIRPYITVDAPHEGEAWTDPQVVNHPIRYDPYRLGVPIQIQDARRFRDGMVVMVRPLDGSPPEYRRLVRARNRNADHDVLVLFPQLERDYELPSMVEVSGLLPKPINVNTAPKEVLVAVMTGLQTQLFQKQSATGRTPPNFVTPTEAAAVADRILKQPLRSHNDLRALLQTAKDDGVIDEGDAEAILQNAVDPADPKLARETVPFCYGSADVYEMTATGIVNDPAANEVARVKTREVVQVAPPRELVWHIDSQEGFQDRTGTRGGFLVKGDPRSFVPAYFRGRWSSLLETFPVDMFALPWLEPDRRHSGPGYAQLATGKDYVERPARPSGNANGPPFQPGAIHREHWDLEREGHPLAQPVAVQPATVPTRRFNVEDNSLRNHLGPGTARAWFRVDALSGARTYFFDTAGDTDRDRLSLYYDAATKELVATVRDESLDSLETGGKPRPCSEVRAPFQFRPRNWYHLALAWKGSDPRELAFLVDGKPLAAKDSQGRTFPFGIEQTGTRTTALIDATALEVPVESTANFPDRGYILVGGYRRRDGLLAEDVGYTYRYANPPWSASQFHGEVLFYESKTATSFRIAPAPNQWGVQWRQRYPNSLGNPPAGADDPIRQPERGTGRWVEIQDPGATPFAIRSAYAHDVGTVVRLWGYTMWLKNGPNWPTRGNRNQTFAPKLPAWQETLTRGQATLLDNLPENTPFTLVYKPRPPGWSATTNPRPIVVQATDTEVPVVWAGFYPDAPTGGGTGTPGGWPRQGFIRVGNERMFYRDIIQDGTGARFVVDRAIDGTTAQVHYLWEPVILESIRITSDADYRIRNSLYEPSVYVQLTPAMTQNDLKATLDPRTPCQVEWLSIMKADATYGAQHVLIPAFQPDVIRQGFGLLPQPTGERFVTVPVQQPPDINTFYRGGDLRWYGEMITLFNQNNGQLPGNPGPIVITTPPPPPVPPPAPGQPPRPPQPQLPPRALPLKEWLKGIEANRSRAQKGTDAPRFGILTPTVTSAAGGRFHVAGEKVVPTFILGTTHPGYQHDLGFLGKGDTVTLADDSAAREERTVIWAAGTDAGTNDLAAGPTLQGDPGTGVMIALDDFVSRPFLAANHARLVRYPSGQLPAGPNQLRVGAPAVAGGGPVQGYVDELIVTQEEEPETFEDRVRAVNGAAWPQSRWPATPYLDDQALAWDTALRPSNGLTRQLQSGLLVRFGDEVIAVNDVDSGSQLGQGVRLVRGVLGTAKGKHGPESSFWWDFPLPRLAVAGTGFSIPREDTIAIRQRPQGPLHDRDFFIAVDRGDSKGIEELIPIREQRGTNLVRPRDRFDRGCFRSSFGSGLAGPIRSGDLLFDWPFRFQDRYNARVASLEGVFFQATKEIPGAFFESVTWDATLPNPYARVLVAVRVNGAPSWDADPAKKSEPGQAGKLYVFDDPKEANLVQLRGDRMEVRVYLTYKPRAFYDDGWKETPVLKAVRVTYRQPLRVRRREELLE